MAYKIPTYHISVIESKSDIGRRKHLEALRTKSLNATSCIAAYREACFRIFYLRTNIKFVSDPKTIALDAVFKVPEVTFEWFDDVKKLYKIEKLYMMALELAHSELDEQIRLYDIGSACLSLFEKAEREFFIYRTMCWLLEKKYGKLLECNENVYMNALTEKDKFHKRVFIVDATLQRFIKENGGASRKRTK